jgi:tetratricopeptide (TPR) repeat protein
MTLTARPRLLALAAAGLAFAAALLVFGVLARSGGTPAPAIEAGTPVLPPGASTQQRIAALQATARSAPSAPAYAALGLAYLQRARETFDPTYYGRADAVLHDGLRRDPGSVAALTGLGTLALARHDFRGGLRYALAARRAAPGAVDPFAVLVDAQVELGAYPAAERSLQAFIDRKPTLASFARVSYFRELHGDLDGALAAMRLAVSAGGAAPENSAYVQTLLGSLELDRGHLAAARLAYGTALAGLPGYVPAQAGLARADAAAGRLGPAIARYREVVARLPLPEHVVSLGEAELAAGRPAAAARDLALVRAEEQLLRANGVDTDVDLALFEANHGDPATAVTLARRAWASAPSVRSADALGWALTRAGRARDGLAWARQALRLGSVDPAFLYHAGMSALAAGDRGAARAWLRASLARNPGWSPLYAPRARRALEALG